MTVEAEIDISNEPATTAVSASDWTTRSSLGTVPLSESVHTTMWCWFSAKYESAGAGTTSVRIRDATNNQTLASASGTAASGVLTATPASFTPSNDIEVEVQLQVASGGANASFSSNYPANVYFGYK